MKINSYYLNQLLLYFPLKPVHTSGAQNQENWVPNIRSRVFLPWERRAPEEFLMELFTLPYEVSNEISPLIT